MHKSSSARLSHAYLMSQPSASFLAPPPASLAPCFAFPSRQTLHTTVCCPCTVTSFQQSDFYFQATRPPIQDQSSVNLIASCFVDLPHSSTRLLPASHARHVSLWITRRMLSTTSLGKYLHSLLPLVFKRPLCITCHRHTMKHYFALFESRTNFFH